MHTSRVNLLNVLTDEDKKKIENYVIKYATGNDADSFCGLDTYLSEWAANNTKLYHLLGDKLIVEFPFCIEKEPKVLKYQMEVFTGGSPFLQSFEAFRREKLADMRLLAFGDRDTYRATPEINDFNDAMMILYADTMTYVKNEIDFSYKYVDADTGKAIQMQKGGKPMKILAKFVKMYPDKFSEKEFEEFRIKHSQILNDKIISGKFCLSIHPLDFMTMSDNSENWRSCMSWTGHGCYRMGTVEMMNSNNVICAYITASTPFTFTGNDKNTYEWNNKKWRQLFFATKDILVGGKSYPYTSEDSTLFGLDVLRQLAMENLNWGYQFGPERYKDMNRINYESSIDKNRDWIAYGNTHKHNIVFSTKGMYNDMLNDSSFHYWCVRNKVKKNKVISYSGKSVCACCGDRDILLENDEYYDDNEADRWKGAGELMCYDCKEDRTCGYCEGFSGSRLYSFEDFFHDTVHACKTCALEHLFTCPCCNKKIMVSSFYAIDQRVPYILLNTAKNQTIYMHHLECFSDRGYRTGFSLEKLEELHKKFPYLHKEHEIAIPLFMCQDCRDEYIEKGIFEQKRYPFNEYDHWSREFYTSTDYYTMDELINHPVFSKCLWYNVIKNNKVTEEALQSEC